MAKVKRKRNLHKATFDTMKEHIMCLHIIVIMAEVWVEERMPSFYGVKERSEWLRDVGQAMQDRRVKVGLKANQNYVPPIATLAFALYPELKAKSKYTAAGFTFNCKFLAQVARGEKVGLQTWFKQHAKTGLIDLESFSKEIATSYRKELRKRKKKK